MGSDLTRIRNKASSEPKLRFTSLYHHVTDKAQLRSSYAQIEPGAAPGVDGVSKDKYGEDPNWFAGNAYDTVMILSNVIEKVGTESGSPRVMWLARS